MALRPLPLLGSPGDAGVPWRNWLRAFVDVYGQQLIRQGSTLNRRRWPARPRCPRPSQDPGLLDGAHGEMDTSGDRRMKALTCCAPQAMPWTTAEHPRVRPPEIALITGAQQRARFESEPGPCPAHSGATVVAWPAAPARKGGGRPVMSCCQRPPPGLEVY